MRKVILNLMTNVLDNLKPKLLKPSKSLRWKNSTTKHKIRKITYEELDSFLEGVANS